MICKILDENNSGLYSWWASAIYYAVNNGAKVINMSVGGSGFSSTLKNAVKYAYINDVTVVVSMMNNDNDIVFYPAGDVNSIAVGSSNPNDERSSPFFWSPSSGSSYGNHIDVIAPGNYIYGLSHQSNVNYNSYWGGTSQAAPLVTGLSSLLLAQNPDLTPDDIRFILQNTAEDEVGKPSEDIAGFDIYHGFGRVNAFEALQSAPVATKENSHQPADLSIYPNPAEDHIFVMCNLDYNSLEIVNINGLEVYKKIFTPQSSPIKINIMALSDGPYILVAKDSKGNFLASKKFVRKK